MKNFILLSTLTITLSFPSSSSETPNDIFHSIKEFSILDPNNYKFLKPHPILDFSNRMTMLVGGLNLMGSLMPRSPLHNFLAHNVGLYQITRGSLLGTGLLAAGTFGIFFNNKIFPETNRDDKTDKWKLRSQYASILALGFGATALNLSPSTSYLKYGIKFVGKTAGFGICMVGGIAFMAASTLTISAINYMVLTPFIGTIEKINAKKKESE